MASVRQKGDGWQMIWWVREVDGERRQRTRQFVGSSKKAALKEARRLEEEAQVLDADAGNETVAGFLKDWLAVHQNKVSARTIDRYRELVEVVATHIGKCRLQDLRPLDLERMYSRLLAGGGKTGQPLIGTDGSSRPRGLAQGAARRPPLAKAAECADGRCRSAATRAEDAGGVDGR
jgi:Phage integrase, N-terminal SAM-like domain